jgi:uncharacterized protein
MLKRIILTILTILAIASLSFSFLKSFSEPQIQSKLELYQTNLILNASQFQSPDGDNSIQVGLRSLLGDDPVKNAVKQYEDAIKTDEQILSQLKPKQVTKAKEIDQLVSELELRLGILNISQNRSDSALKIWQDLVKDENPQFSAIAQVLIDVFSNKSNLDYNQAETLIKTQLDGWFRFQVLTKLYQQQNRPDAMIKLNQEIQANAEKSIFNVVFISIIPVIGCISGVGIIIFTLVQLLLVKIRTQSSENPTLPILSLGDNIWETPWNGEIIWQVLIGGFFFITQVVLPILLSEIKGLLPHLDPRGEAVWLLITYLIMAIGSIAVLYLSIKPYLPLAQTWFFVKIKSPWFLWGIGGYLVAIPLVIIVSLINQQIWQGQGGSNPILSLALENNDMVTLGIFFVTAAIAAPLFEEFLFRGFLLASLTKYLSNWGAIAVSALIFALAHLNASEILPLATLGMVLGFVYTKSKNLLAPMFLHCLWNSGTLISLFLLGQ